MYKHIHNTQHGSRKKKRLHFIINIIKNILLTFIPSSRFTKTHTTSHNIKFLCDTLSSDACSNLFTNFHFNKFSFEIGSFSARISRPIQTGKHH